MPLIRVHAELPPLLTEKVIKSTDVEIIFSAQELMQKTRAHCEEVNNDLDNIILNAKQQGYEAGLEEGRKEAAFQHWKTVISTVQYFRQVENLLINVIIESLRRMILELPPSQRIAQLVGRALSDLGDLQYIRICVNPLIINDLRNALGMIPTSPLLDIVELKERVDIPEDFCILETPIGIIDLSLESQLSILKDNFIKKLISKNIEHE